MYSFAQRADVAAVLDEPLYPAWLRAHPEAERPVSADTYKQPLPAPVGIPVRRTGSRFAASDRPAGRFADLNIAADRSTGQSCWRAPPRTCTRRWRRWRRRRPRPGPAGWSSPSTSRSRRTGCGGRSCWPRPSSGTSSSSGGPSTSWPAGRRSRRRRWTRRPSRSWWRCTRCCGRPGARSCSSTRTSCWPTRRGCSERRAPGSTCPSSPPCSAGPRARSRSTGCGRRTGTPPRTRRRGSRPGRRRRSASGRPCRRPPGR